MSKPKDISPAKHEIVNDFFGLGNLSEWEISRAQISDIGGEYYSQVAVGVILTPKR